jgi:HPt (histidine-containing phosphotransfer) domain-containing protein
VTGSGPLENAAVENAERALTQLSGQFKSWMRNEVDALIEAKEAIARDGLSPESQALLFRTAHDIRGEAATLGFPLAGRIAGSLCRLLEEAPSAEQIPLELVLHHADAIRAASGDDAAGAGPAGRALADALEAFVGRFLASAKE